MASTLHKTATRASRVSLAWLVRPRVGAAVLVLVGVASVLPATWDLARVASIAVSQLGGPAEGTDFLNLFTGARLFVDDPAHTYDLAAQLRVQQSLTGRDSLIVPFFLPPHAVLLLAPLAALPYGAAYLTWLAVNVACLVASVHLLAPASGRWRLPLWSAASLLFLPTILTLGQGQTSLLYLLAYAILVRGAPIAVLLCTLKPPLTVAPLLALLLARCGRCLVTLACALVATTALALWRIGPQGLAAYRDAAATKTLQTFTEDPVDLLGPTLLHASRWFVNSPVPGLLLGLATVLSLCVIWRHGLAQDDARLLQLALIPLVAVLAAPYALVYELTPWLASFWLLWRYTTSRSDLRAALLWLVAPVWAAANVGVALPREGGADHAALFGFLLVAWVVWAFYNHRQPNTCPRGSE